MLYLTNRVCVADTKSFDKLRKKDTKIFSVNSFITGSRSLCDKKHELAKLTTMYVIQRKHFCKIFSELCDNIRFSKKYLRKSSKRYVYYTHRISRANKYSIVSCPLVRERERERERES